jgi:hypothetical protein
MNTLSAIELKRRGIAAIEEGLRKGPLHLVKRNRPAAVVLSEDEYQRLLGGQGERPASSGMTAVQWLLSVASTGNRGKADIDAALEAERRNWEKA